jgi:hypothetical protein
LNHPSHLIEKPAKLIDADALEQRLYSPQCVIIEFAGIATEAPLVLRQRP